MRGHARRGSPRCRAPKGLVWSISNRVEAKKQDGLAAARDADPETRAKMEVRDWIEQCLDSLQTEKDAIEAELEVIRSKQKKNQKGTKSEREEELDGYRARHNYHVSRLELMLRLLDNDNLGVDEINNVKDDVNYYIESNQDPDFQVSFFRVYLFVSWCFSLCLLHMSSRPLPSFRFGCKPTGKGANDCMFSPKGMY